MKKVLTILSIILTVFGFKSLAQNVDAKNNRIVAELSKSGLSDQEIAFLDQLASKNPALFEKAILQDLRIKGPLKEEIFASANRGGGTCVHGD